MMTIYCVINKKSRIGNKEGGKRRRKEGGVREGKTKGVRGEWEGGMEEGKKDY